MKNRYLAILGLAIAVLGFAACGSDSTSDPTSKAAGSATDHAWLDLQVTDVDGVAFTMRDFVGTPVFVENFATWCPTCRSQLGDTQTAAAELGDNGVVIALSTETSLSPRKVADYASENGFTNVRFAVMTPELLAAMVDQFGNSSVNPPSTPHVIIDAAGVPGEMHTGRISAKDIVADTQSAVG